MGGSQDLVVIEWDSYWRSGKLESQYQILDD